MNGIIDWMIFNDINLKNVKSMNKILATIINDTRAIKLNQKEWHSLNDIIKESLTKTLTWYNLSEFELTSSLVLA